MVFVGLARLFRNFAVTLELSAADSDDHCNLRRPPLAAIAVSADTNSASKELVSAPHAVHDKEPALSATWPTSIHPQWPVRRGQRSACPQAGPGNEQRPVRHKWATATFLLTTRASMPTARPVIKIQQLKWVITTFQRVAKHIVTVTRPCRHQSFASVFSSLEWCMEL